MHDLRHVRRLSKYGRGDKVLLQQIFYAVGLSFAVFGGSCTHASIHIGPDPRE